MRRRNSWQCMYAWRELREVKERKRQEGGKTVEQVAEATQFRELDEGMGHYIMSDMIRTNNWRGTKCSFIRNVFFPFVKQNFNHLTPGVSQVRHNYKARSLYCNCRKLFYIPLVLSIEHSNHIK